MSKPGDRGSTPTDVTTTESRRTTLPPLIAITGLPGQLRDAWAFALGAISDTKSGLPGSGLAEVTHSTKPDIDYAPPTVVEPSGEVAKVGFTSAPAPVLVCSTEVVASIEMLLSQHSDLKILGFYLPPWEAFLEASEESGLEGRENAMAWMANWHRYHERLLAARMASPDQVMLINAGRVADQGAFLQGLRDAGLQLPTPQSLPPTICSDTPVSRLLAAHIAEADPEYWELYESLESCALLLGREPEFRAASQLVEISEIGGVLDAVRGVHCALSRKRRLNAQLRDASHEHGQALERLQADLGAERVGRAEIEGRSTSKAMLLLELQQENELLSLQLQQVHAELDHYRAADSLRPSSADITPAISTRENATEQLALKSALLEEVQHENELLGLQLQQVHEELEHHVAGNAELRELFSRAGEAAERARRLISRLANAD